MFSLRHLTPLQLHACAENKKVQSVLNLKLKRVLTTGFCAEFARTFKSYRRDKQVITKLRESYTRG